MDVLARFGYQDVFDDQPPEMDSLLNILPTMAIVNWSTLLISLFDRLQYNNESEWNHLIDGFLSGIDDNIKQELRFKFQTSKFSSGTVIHPTSCLLLMNLSFNKHVGGPSCLNGLQQLLIFKLLLLANDILNKNENEFEYFNPFQSKLNMARFHAVCSFSTYELDSYRIGFNFNCQLIKFSLLRRFLMQSDEGKILLEYFQQTNKLISFEQYFFWIFTPIVSYVDGFFDKKIIRPIIKIANPEERKHEIEFFDSLCYMSQTNPLFSSKVSTDVRILKQYPLVKVSDEEYLVVFFPFLLNKIFDSLLHNLRESFEEIRTRNEFRKIKDIKSYFGKAFIEEYYVKHVLEIITNCSKQRLYSENDLKMLIGMKSNEMVSLPDFYVRDDNRIFMFEVKDILIRSDVKTSKSIEEIEQFLSIKFVLDKNGKKIGVFQIFKFIDHILNMSSNFFDHYKKSKKLNFYPILIVTDITFMTSGLNIILNDKIEGEKLELEKAHNIKIFPVTIIHIDTLLYFKEVFSKSKILLQEAIEAYHKYMLNSTIIDSTISFHEYFRRYILNRKIPFPSKPKVDKSYLFDFMNVN